MRITDKTERGQGTGTRPVSFHYPEEENFAEPFSHGTTWIHRLDPRFRLLSAVALSIAIAVLHRPEGVSTALVVAILLLVLSRPPRKPLFHRLAAVSFFLLFLWALVPLSAGGVPLFSFGPLHFSRHGVFLCLAVTGKSLAVVSVFLALVASISASDLGKALQGIGAPSKFTQLFLFTYRYAHVLLESWQRLQTAARLRCFRPRTSLHTYKTYAYMLGMLFVNSLERSERIYEAMLLRGFDGSFHSLSLFRARKSDVAFLLLSSAFAVALMIWDGI